MNHISIPANPFLRLKQALRGHDYQADFPIGSLISDLWTNPESGRVYTSPFRIVDYRNVHLPSGEDKFAVILLRVHTTFRKNEFHEHIQSYSREYLNGTYYAGCSSALRNTITPIQPGRRADSVKLFLPRPENLHLNPLERSDIDQLAWKYFQDTTTDCSQPCPKRAFTDLSGSPETCLLYGDGLTWCLYSNGSADRIYYRALFNLVFTPACAITV